MPSCPRLVAVALSVLAVAPALAASARAADRPIFVLTDPRGDDHGDGTMKYPLSYYDLQPGDLDLVSLAAYAEADGTRFEATFASRVRPTGRRTIDIGGTSLDSIARFGFYTTNLDIYVDTDRQEGSGGVQMLPGRKAQLDPRFAWERAIALTPRPFDARSTLKRILLRDLRDTLKADPKSLDAKTAEAIKLQIPADVESHVFFPTKIRVRGPKITFWVPAEALGGIARPDWAYTVVVTGTDIDQRFDLSNALSVAAVRRSGLMILPLGVGRPTDSFGGGREDDDLQPPLVDILVPPGPLTQERVLGDYDATAARPAVVPAVVPADLP